MVLIDQLDIFDKLAVGADELFASLFGRFRRMATAYKYIYLDLFMGGVFEIVGAGCRFVTMVWTDYKGDTIMKWKLVLVFVIVLCYVFWFLSICVL